MPRKLPPFVTKERTRHGQIVFYFRRGKGKRIRLPSINDKNFDEAYQAILSGAEPREPVKLGAGSLSWLIRQYRTSAAYLALSQATRRQRDNIFKHVETAAGKEPYKAITKKHITDGRERRKATPSQARNFLDAMRGLFRWALEYEYVSVDPTAAVTNPKRPKGKGFPAWTESDVAQYEAYWQEGTRERVWMHVLLYTGLRRGDAVRLGKQHIKDGLATIWTEKTGIEVNIPILPALENTIDRGPVGDLALIVGARGLPMVKESFGNEFKRACKAAGIENKSAHGLRKIGATRAAEAGATIPELEALFGWTGGTMASHYTKTANRKQLARQASEKIRNSLRPHFAKGAGNGSISR